MATTENIYTGDGATVLFSFTFPYLDESHIKVSVNGVDTTAYTLANATTVQMNSAPANGATVRIYRETNIDNLSATFYPGSAIRASDLNNNFTQNLYIDQEAVSYSIRTDGNKAMQADLDLGGFNIVNLADPTAIDEAATKGYVDTVTLAGIPDGDRGDITVSSSGTVFSIDNGVIDDANVSNSAAIQSTKLSFTQAGSGAVARTVQSKLRDVVSVKDYGALGDGVADDTAAIRAALAANQGKRIYFPPGTYRFAGNDPEYLGAGTVVFGAGRFSTKIVSIVQAPPSLFYCQGYGSGVESMAFDSEVQQTGGCYVFLGGPESYITDFYMNGDYRGVIMTGNVAQIRHGRFQDAAPSAIRITCGGGDNSQTISNVLMGAQTPPNIATAGIRLQNSVALTIENVSVIQQGFGLLIDPDSPANNVLSLYCNQCFFDNCTYPIYIGASGGGAVRRLYFTDVWASSGINGVTIDASTGTVRGVHFTNLQAHLNSGSGVTTGGSGVSELTFTGGAVSANSYGFYFNAAVDKLEILSVRVGDYDNLGAGNTNDGIVFGAAGFTSTKVINCSLEGNGGVSLLGFNNLGADCRVEGNIGFNPVGASVITLGASPFTYTAGASPETLYVTGGTISSIDIGGLGVFVGSEHTLHLGPKESAVFTYTVAPTVRKYIH
jgi:hypothetical protein